MRMSPRRIVTLLPAATEIVSALGCANRLKGRSFECDFPEEVTSLPACTGTRLPVAASGAEIDRDVRSLQQGGQSLYKIDVQQLRDLPSRT